MWLSLEFHYVSKDTLNDMASQVKVNSCMTVISINSGGKPSKGDAKSMFYYTSKNTKISFIKDMFINFTRKLFTNNEAGIIRNIEYIYLI